MKTVNDIAPIRGAAAKILGSGMNVTPKRDRSMGPVFVLAVVGIALLVLLS
jgi:hypothetical protein